MVSPGEGLDNPVDIGYHLDRVKTPDSLLPHQRRSWGEEILATGSSFEKRESATGAGRTDEIRMGPGLGSWLL